jgi:hypothetical protein
MFEKPGSSYYGLVAILVALVLALVFVTNFYVLFYALIVAAAGVAMAVVGIVGYLVYWAVANHLVPVKRVRARVIARRFKEWDITPPLPWSGIVALAMTDRNRNDIWRAWSRFLRRKPAEPGIYGKDFFVTFEYLGSTFELNVSEADYVRCSEGATGWLKHQGELFRGFAPDPSDAQSAENVPAKKPK